MSSTFERRQYGRNHAYYLDGAKLPGVTTILSNGLPAPALVEWAAKTTATYAVNEWDRLATLGVVDRYEAMRGARWEVLRAAGLRGTDIHGLAHAVVTGEDVNVPDEYVGPVEALANLMDKTGMNPVMREAPVVHVDHRWAGTLDVVALIDGQVWLLDYKTGKGLYEKDALQVSAYANATHYLDAGALLDFPRIERVGLIHVTSDSATLHEVTDVADNYATFRHVQEVAEWLGSLKEAPVIGEAL